jgi:hypothetical protein
MKQLAKTSTKTSSNKDEKEYDRARFNLDDKQSRIFKCTGWIIKAQLLVNGLIISEVLFDNDNKKEEHPLSFFGKEAFHCMLCNKSIYVDLYYLVKTPLPSLHIGELGTPITLDMILSGSYVIQDEAYQRFLDKELKYINR